MRAQEAKGVILVESKFKRSSKYCEVGERYCKRHEEKQTDVAFATTLFADALEAKMDRAVLLTADTDQIPLVKQMQRLFPDIGLTLAAPPGRAGHARELGDLIPDRLKLDSSRLLAHQLPRLIAGPSGKIIAKWPAEYDDGKPTKKMFGAPDPDHLETDPIPPASDLPA